MTLSTFNPARPVSEPHPEEVIERLFLRLTAFYGNKFSDSFGISNMAQIQEIWGEELSRYSIREINRGVAACRTLKWPPTLPEFLTACRPPVDPASAYSEAIANMILRDRGENPEYSHPAIFWAARFIGDWDMRHIERRQMEKRWTSVLDRFMTTANLNEVPPPPLLLSEPEGKPPSPERRAELSAQLARLTKLLTQPLTNQHESQSQGEKS